MLSSSYSEVTLCATLHICSSVMLLTCCTDLVPGNPHLCQMDCHSGSCSPCPQTTMVKCRCGNMDREIACQDLTTRADDARCEKKCTKVWIHNKLHVLSACNNIFIPLVSTVHALCSFTNFSSVLMMMMLSPLCILPKKITYLTSCGKCLTHWHEEEEETLLLTMYLQNSDNDNADF